MPAKIPFDQEYKTPKKAALSFPDDHIPFKKKDEKWHRQYAQAILHDYFNDDCAVAYSRRDKMISNRLYADGENSPTEFQDMVFEFQADDKERQAWANIDTSIIPIIAKFKSAFVGKIGSVEFRVGANAIDPYSMREKDKQKYLTLTKSIFRQEFAQIEQGLKIKPKRDEYIPETKDELEILSQLGGFKLGIENAIEKAVNWCFEMSGWSEEIMPQIVADLFENNGAACRDYLDKNTMTVKQQYVELVNFIAQYSKSPTLKNSRYFGHIVDYTIAELRVRFPKADEKVWRDLANKYNGQYGNASITNFMNTIGDTYGPYNDSTKAASSYHYDKMKIPVAELEFESVMYEYDTEKTDAFGNKSYFPNDKERKYNDENRKAIKTPIKVWHKVSLIVGTEHIFDWGLQHDIPRPTYEDAKSSFHAIIFRGKSLCERSIPHYRQIQLNYIQLQHHVARADPPGIAIEWKALTNITLNGNEMGPLDLLKIRSQTGRLIYSATTARGTMNSPSTYKPIQELKSGITSDIMFFINIIDHHIGRIREITGVNDMIGTTEPTATQAQMNAITSDASLKSLYTGYLNLIKMTSINAAARLRDLLAYSEEAREIYGPIIGMGTVQIMDIAKDLPAANLSIMIHVNLKDEGKDKIRQAAIAAMKPGKEGVPVLRFSDYLMIERLLDAGNLILASAIIAYKEAKIEELSMARAKQDQEINAQFQMANNQQKIEIDQAKQNTQAENEIKVYKEKIEADKEFEAHVHTLKMEELEKQGQIERSKTLEIA